MSAKTQSIDEARHTTNAAVAAIIPLSTRALASLHVLAVATAAAVMPSAVAAPLVGVGAGSGGVGVGGGGGGGSLPTNDNVAALPLLGYHPAAASSSLDTCYPAAPTISTSSHVVASHHHPQQEYSYYNQYQQHGNTNADWLFSINLLYLIAAPLLLRELPAMMATLDPLIDYLFEPSSWLAFPGWCAELWRLFREEKGRITVSRRNSADALRRRASGSLDDAGVDVAEEVPRRSRTW
ncbi:hypothetical protein JOL62DRAFT_610366 [Phyllosticta paracitricarpa]|uniref:Uncharacterized protein n=1 Tax=Phyllosticta paracitricarpa TaxID=2016321 RepID=A0ABR1NET5_9PEZI